ncbi:hypothetical protein [Streptomyces sp. NPDC012508]|uniref:hypothetical protein n=1 Tax=Streptomyces sp. NPDC012508 TaxID=3364837 RepID=UPI0036893026
MAGGTIAISGPRGVGKSTLLKSVTRNWEPDHLVVPVEIPAAYVPQEFLLSLFQRVCEEFLALHGHAVDSSSMFLVKLRKHLLKRLRHLALLSVRLLAAGTLLVIALAPLGVGVRVKVHRSVRGNVHTPATQNWGPSGRAAAELSARGRLAGWP